MWSPYAYGLNAKVYIKPDGWAKFVNQCNQPNSRIQKWNYGEKENLAIVALRWIEYNEEITIDYRDGTISAAMQIFKCQGYGIHLPCTKANFVYVSLVTG